MCGISPVSMSTLFGDSGFGNLVSSVVKGHAERFWEAIDECLPKGCLQTVVKAASASIQQKLFLVWDTNVFIHYDPEVIKEKLVERFGNALQIVLPFSVIQEIGNISKNGTRRHSRQKDQIIKETASKSNAVLFGWLSNRDRSVYSQDSAEVTKHHSVTFGIIIKTNDDQLIECLLQTKTKHSADVVGMLSKDINLLDKVMNLGFPGICVETLGTRLEMTRTIQEFVKWVDPNLEKTLQLLKRKAEASCRRLLKPHAANHSTIFEHPVGILPLATGSEMLMLRDLSLSCIASQLNERQSSVFRLHEIEEKLASQILDFLIKNKQLKPDLMQNFISCRLQKMNFDYSSSCTNALLHAVSLHAQLKQLSLKSCQRFTEMGLQSLTGLKFLQKLNLAGCPQVCDTCIPVFRALQSLVCLSLEGTEVSEAGIKEYMAYAPQQLRDLNLCCTKVTEGVFLHLANAPSLVSLNMAKTQIGGLSGIQRLVKLIELNISNTLIITDSLLCLINLNSLNRLICCDNPNVNGDVAVSYLAHLPLQVFQLPNFLTTTDEAVLYLTEMNLVELDLTDHIYITDGSMPYIGQMKRLTVLRLCNTQITDKGMIHLQGLSILKELNLDHTSVGNVGITFIQGFKELRILSLSNTGVTNGFLRSGVLNSCLELTKLSLSRNTISNQGIICLRLPKLTFLNVDETFISPEAIKKLRMSCPLLNNFVYQALNAPPWDEDEFD